MAGGSVDFGVPAERAYDFLVDPLQRPRWQSSLHTVEVLDGWSPGDPADVGLRWIDVTKPGLRPLMTLTEAERPRRWSESGQWRGFSADLTLDFVPTATGCRVDAEFEVRAAGVLRPLGRVATLAGVRPVLADLRRAARTLEAA